MALQQVDITVTQGEDFANTWIVASPDPSGQGNRASDVYYNFTGSAARMTIRQQQDSASLVIRALTIGAGLAFAHAQEPGGPPDPGAGAPNAVSVTITAAQSLAMTPGVYFYDLFIDWPNGTHTELLAGEFRVNSSVTR